MSSDVDTVLARYSASSGTWDTSTELPETPVPRASASTATAGSSSWRCSSGGATPGSGRPAPTGRPPRSARSRAWAPAPSCRRSAPSGPTGAGPGRSGSRSTTGRDPFDPTSSRSSCPGPAHRRPRMIRRRAIRRRATPPPSDGQPPVGSLPTPGGQIPTPPSALPNFASIVTLPSARRCVTRRSLRLRVRVPAGTAVIAIEATIKGKRVKIVRGSRPDAPDQARPTPARRVSPEDHRSSRGRPNDQPLAAIPELQAQAPRALGSRRRVGVNTGVPPMYPGFRRHRMRRAPNRRRSRLLRAGRRRS